MKKLVDFIRYFARAKKIWSWPKKSELLVIDVVPFDFFLDYLGPWSPERLYIRGEEINLRVLAASFFRRGKRSEAYIDCFIEKVCPKLLITAVDNSLHYCLIGARHPDIKTMFVQNGWRSHGGDIFELLDNAKPEITSNLQVDYMLVFGPTIGEGYARYIRGANIAVGALKNNHIRKEQSVRRGTVAFVSQWLEGGVHMYGKYYDADIYFGITDRIVVQFLQDYARENDKRLVIIPRTPRNSVLREREELYFNELLGGAVEFADFPGKHSSYMAIDASEVVVSIDSTLGYESIARGNKTGIFSIRGSLLGVRGLTYGWPGNFSDDGLFWTNRPECGEFKRILDYLFRIGEEQWYEDIGKSGFSSLMIYNPNNSILKSVLDRALKPVPGILNGDSYASGCNA